MRVYGVGESGGPRGITFRGLCGQQHLTVPGLHRESVWSRSDGCNAEDTNVNFDNLVRHPRARIGLSDARFSFLPVLDQESNSLSLSHPAQAPSVPTMGPERPRYIGEIDGLRAFAVAAVLLFHAFPKAVPGGYIGVDVFFAVSGFVIARTYLWRLIDRETSLRKFFLRRVRRLAPVYSVVLAATTVAAFVLFEPDRLWSYAKSLLAQPFYVQNVTFWLEGSYFMGGIAKPLLHTWSLAVEEQFYLLFGAGILILRRWRSLLWPMLLAALLVSFVAGLYFVDLSPKTGFYLVPFRVWEFVVGVLAFLVSDRLKRRTAGPVELGLAAAAAIGLGVSVMAFVEEAAFPGPQAILAMFSTGALMVLFDARPSAAYAPLKTGWIRRLGELSYSLYLWHWPLIVFGTFLVGRPLGILEAMAALVGSYALSELTFRLVEDPVRRGARLSSTTSLIRWWLVSSTVVAGVGLGLTLSNGALFRYAEPVRTIYSANFSQPPNRRCGLIYRLTDPESEMCQANTASARDRGVLLLGDSHADVLDEQIGEMAEKVGTPVYIGVRGCELDVFGTIGFCPEGFLSEVLKQAHSRGIDRVVAVSKWPSDITNTPTSRNAQQIIDSGFYLYIIESIPQSVSLDPRTIADNILHNKSNNYLTREQYMLSLEANNAIFRQIQRRNPGRVTILRPGVAVCPGTVCDPLVFGFPTHLDSTHLSQPAVHMIMPWFKSIVTY